MSPATLHAVFNWDFVTAMTSASVAVIAVANTLASLALRAPGRFRVSRAWTAFIASMMLTIYAAWLGGWSWHPGRLAEIVAHGLVLFCVAAGLHESVFAVARRVPGGRGAAAAAGAGPAAAPAPGGGWWASWF